MPQSSQLTEPLWTDPVRKSGISVRELISTFKNNTKSATATTIKSGGGGGGLAGNEWSNILPKSSEARKKATNTMTEVVHLS